MSFWQRLKLKPLTKQASSALSPPRFAPEFVPRPFGSIGPETGLEPLLPEKSGEKLENVLILAHPGHELRIHHWLEIAKPRVYLLTDGSGGKETSRTRYSRDLVEAAGATRGAVFGEIPDGAWYEALLAGNHDFLIDVFSRVRADLTTAKSVQIVSDAVDGYNPIHDLAFAFGQALCRGLRKTAQVGKQLCSAAVPNVAGRVESAIQLSPAARARKIAAVENYSPLADEARRILERDPQCFDRENLMSQDFDWNSSWTPEWERIGKQRVADGRYRQCITYRDNVQPAARRLMSESAAVFAAAN
ncbi:hypothetical protein NLY43_01735 [Mesorhizobium sp. C416B]|uniref:hypothetical protein n=1 Tax=unclassified Mesorhizobium TaxID=325217 RepID=UPI000422F1EC|nr:MULTISPECIES: hypothetical protein [unclassified Mesorhizobium]WJI63532.1 hypothetical protein NLY43_01735 [Mesorhizobium sp. C416B]